MYPTKATCVQGLCPYIPLQQGLSSKLRWTKSAYLSNPNNVKLVSIIQEAAASSPMKTGSGANPALISCSWTVHSWHLAWTQKPMSYTSSSLKLGAVMWLQKTGKGNKHWELEWGGLSLWPQVSFFLTDLDDHLYTLCLSFPTCKIWYSEQAPSRPSFHC